MANEQKNEYIQLAGKIGGSSVFLAAAIMIFGGNAGVAIGGVAILCGFGVLMALFTSRKHSCCNCESCAGDEKKSKPTKMMKSTKAKKKK